MLIQNIFLSFANPNGIGPTSPKIANFVSVFPPINVLVMTIIIPKNITIIPIIASCVCSILVSCTKIFLNTYCFFVLL